MKLLRPETALDTHTPIREIFDKSKKGATATSDFVVGFPHDKHIEIVSATETPQNAICKCGVHKVAEKSGGRSELCGLSPDNGAAGDIGR